jgi:prolipoprotein diacylglyceryltransferase
MFPFVQMSILGLPLFIWICVLAFFTHFVLTSRRWVRYGHSWLTCFVVYLYGVFFGVLGSKAFEIADNFFYYSHNPMKILSMKGHGWNGLYLASMLSLLVLLLLWKKPVLQYLDAYTLYVPIGIIIGRSGCLLTAVWK